MDQRRRSNLVIGLLLLLFGTAVLVLQLVPGVYLPFSWPWIIIGVGCVLLVLGAATGVPALAVPASVVGGIGGILAYQVATGDWDSWAYIWALIPGFVGLGLVLAGVLSGGESGTIQAGGWLLFISLVLLATFGSLFGALGLIGPYWPILLIILGLALLVGPLLKGRKE
jgi:hypothetical protein